MPLLAALTDDQIALAGCLSALVVCGGLMSLSYYLRPKSERELDQERADTLSFPNRTQRPAARDDAGRKAA